MLVAQVFWNLVCSTIPGNTHTNSHTELETQSHLFFGCNYTDTFQKWPAPKILLLRFADPETAKHKQLQGAPGMAVTHIPPTKSSGGGGLSVTSIEILQIVSLAINPQVKISKLDMV